MLRRTRWIDIFPSGSGQQRAAHGSPAECGYKVSSPVGGDMQSRMRQARTKHQDRIISEGHRGHNSKQQQYPAIAPGGPYTIPKTSARRFMHLVVKGKL